MLVRNFDSPRVGFHLEVHSHFYVQPSVAALGRQGALLSTATQGPHQQAADGDDTVVEVPFVATVKSA